MNEGLGGVIGNRGRANKYVVQTNEKEDDNKIQNLDNFDKLENNTNIEEKTLEHQYSINLPKQAFSIKSNIRDLKLQDYPTMYFFIALVLMIISVICFAVGSNYNEHFF